MRTTRDLVRKARTLYNSEWATPELNRRNRKAWVRSVQYLGPKWVYWDVQKLERKQ